MRHLLLAITLGLTATTALAGAGHDSGHGEDSQNTPEAKIDRTIQVTAGDLWFKPDDLSIEPGETVKFVVKNTGKLAHEFVIGSADKQAEHREMMQEMAANGEGGHDMSAGHHDMEGPSMPSVTVAAGETKTLVWTAAESDNNVALVYACNIPGHYEAGMRGELAVRG